MKWILVLVSGLLTHFILSSNADECARNQDVNGNAKEAKQAPLHHIIEFGKRSKVEVKNCDKNNSKKSNSKTPGTILGLHGLLHARSQQKDKQNATKGKGKISSLKNITFQKTKNELGSKRTNGDLHKLQLKEETIGMLHKIVEKYFPGGHLTVDQKIKALRILGKLIKLKKEGKNTDIKKLLGALSLRNQNGEGTRTSTDSKEKEVKDEKGESEKKAESKSVDEGDIYANIASGPDVPKLPPAVSGKDPEHSHSNIMPVGLQPMGGAGGMMNSLARPNDVSNDLSERISSYRASLGNTQGGMGLGQTYQNDNNFLGNSMGLSNIPNMMNGQGYARSHMPYPGGRYRGRGWLNAEARRRFYDDYDDEDDDDDDEDDDDVDDEGRARSYVSRNHFDDEDDDADNEEEIEYTRRFDRKDKIAKSPKKSTKHGLKRKRLKHQKKQQSERKSKGYF